MSWRLRPRRAARGRVSQAAGGVGIFSAVGLQNNSSGAELILVRTWRLPGTGALSAQFSYNSIAGLAASGVMDTLVPGEAQLAGQLVGGTAAALPGTDWQVSMAVGTDAWWIHDYPFAVLRPGDTLVVAGLVANNGITADFLWEVLYAEELERFEKLVGSDW